MNKILRLWMLIALVAALGESTAVPAQQSTVLAGRVVRADDPSMPLGRVRIGIARNGVTSGRVFTDDQGRFEINVPGLAGLTLTAAKPGFVAESLSAPARRPAQPLEIRLTRGAALGGRVIDSAGRPVRLSSVSMRALARDRDGDRPPARQAVSNDLGEFRISGLAEGRYELTSGFVHERTEEPEDWQPRPMLVLGAPVPKPDVHVVEIPAGQDLFVVVTHNEPDQTPDESGGGAITGTVLDDYGLPAEGLRVRLWQWFRNAGQTSLREISMARTNDQGRYRLFDVPAGRYFVGADDPSGVFDDPALTAGAPVFYPAAPSPSEAQPIDLGRDQEMNGIDVTFRVHLRARLYGLAIDASGQPYRGNLTLAAPQGLPSLGPRTASASDGVFEFANVPPGDYILRATVYRNGFAPGASAAADVLERARLQLRGIGDSTIPTEFSVRRLSIGTGGDDVGPIRVQTVVTSSLSGRVVFQGTSPDGPRERVALSAIPADLDLAPESDRPGGTEVRVDDVGAFEIRGVTSSSRLAVRAPPGWWLKSIDASFARDPAEVIDVGGRFGSRSDVTIVVAGTAATLSGQLLDDRTQPANVVILFADDDTRWFHRSPYVLATAATTNKRFTVTSIPPGTYFVAALDLQDDDASNNEWWREPEFLRRLSTSARRITLSEGDVRTTNLRLIRPPD